MFLIKINGHAAIVNQDKKYLIGLANLVYMVSRKMQEDFYVTLALE